MRIALERILSLIPRKENGKFVHGALSDFARKIGYKDGHIISDWIAGNSTSYLNKLHEISLVYGVSLEWLKGETDIRAPTFISESGLGETKYDQLTPEHRKIVDSMIEQLLASQSPE